MIALQIYAFAALLLARCVNSFHSTGSFGSRGVQSAYVKNSELYSSPDGGAERTFANYIIYKSRAAVAVKIIPPTFQLSGSTGKSRSVSREGGLLLEFALSSGPKEYDWTKKGTFLLSAAECGEMILFDASKPGMELFHDPSMGATNAGQVTKKLKLSAAADGKGVFLSLAINDKATQSLSYSVPVSWGELQVFKSLADYSIPRMLGFDKIWENPIVLGMDTDKRTN